MVFTHPGLTLFTEQVLAAIPLRFLYRIAQNSRVSSRERAVALHELLRRGQELERFVIAELAVDTLVPSWRNTLLLATEHMDFLDSGQRSQIRQRLLTHAAALTDEIHPRSRLAQEAALRRYASLLDEKRDIGAISTFLQSKYSLRCRQVALQAVQNVFRQRPPTDAEREDLRPLAQDLIAMCSYYLSKRCLDGAEEEFTLGLNALFGVIRMADSASSNTIGEVAQIGRPWVLRAVHDYLADTLDLWQQQGIDFDRQDLQRLRSDLARIETALFGAGSNQGTS